MQFEAYFGITTTLQQLARQIAQVYSPFVHGSHNIMPLSSNMLRTIGSVTIPTKQLTSRATRVSSVGLGRILQQRQPSSSSAHLPRFVKAHGCHQQWRCSSTGVEPMVRLTNSIENGSKVCSLVI